MNTAAEVLLIIVSSVLSIFLLVGIIATVKVIQVLNHIKRITEKAESIADKAEAVGEFFEKSAGPAAVAKLIGNIMHSIKSKKEEKGRKRW